MAAASVASARSVPAISSPSALNAAVPSRSSPTTASGDAVRGPAQQPGRPGRASTPGAARRASTARVLAASRSDRDSGRRPEPAQDAVPPLEPGRDRLAGERRRHHRERQHPGDQEVDPRFREREHRRGREQQQQDRRDDDREQQLLAVAQGEPELDRGLGGQPPAQRRRARRRCDVERDGGHERSPCPVRSRKTSSSVRAPVESRSGMTPRPAHQPVTVARNAGVDDSAGPGNDPGRSRWPVTRRAARPAAHRRGSPGGPSKRSVRSASLRLG